MSPVEKIIALLSAYHKLPEAQFEFEVYRHRPDLTKELAVRLFTPNGEKWVRGNPLPVSPELFSKWAAEHLPVLASRYKAEFIEVHVSTCAYDGAVYTGRPVQVELFFDFDSSEQDRLYAYSTAHAEAVKLYRALGRKGQMVYSGNRSVHLILTERDIGFEITEDYLKALATALRNTRFIAGNAPRELRYLDVGALSTMCHLRRMLYSPNYKSRLMSVPVGEATSYSDAVELMKELLKRVLEKTD